jgi:predicted Zn-ribbon and HTH transcriptional regulator
MNECKRCGHKWDSRVKDPKSCPACHTYKWKEPVRPEYEEARTPKQAELATA